MRGVEQKLARLVAYAELHPPGEKDVRGWHLEIADRPALDWTLASEFRRPECIHNKLESGFGQLSADDAKKVANWLALRRLTWNAGCPLRGAVGSLEAAANRKLKAAMPGPDATAEVYRQIASMVPKQAYEWAAVFPKTGRTRRGFSMKYPLKSMVVAFPWITAMGDRFPEMRDGQGLRPFSLDGLPEWTRLGLSLPEIMRGWY